MWGRATLLVCWGILRPCIRGNGGQSCFSQLQRRVRQGTTRQKAGAVSPVHVSHAQFHSLIHAWIDSLSWKNPVTFLLLLFFFIDTCSILRRNHEDIKTQSNVAGKLLPFTWNHAFVSAEILPQTLISVCPALCCVRTCWCKISTPFHSHFVVFASYEGILSYFQTRKKNTRDMCFMAPI